MFELITSCQSVASDQHFNQAILIFHSLLREVALFPILSDLHCKIVPRFHMNRFQLLQANSIRNKFVFGRCDRQPVPSSCYIDFGFPRNRHKKTGHQFYYKAGCLSLANRLEKNAL